MPELVKLYIRHTLIGFALAGVFVAFLFWFDVVGLWHLVTHTEGGWLAAALLVIFNGIVFSGVQFGIAVMGLQRPDDDHHDTGRRDAIPVEVTIPVRTGEIGRR